MLLARRHRFAAGAVIALLAGSLSGAGKGQEIKLITQCQPAQLTAARGPAAASKVEGNPTAIADCDVWAADAVVFKGVKAALKGRREAIETRYTPFLQRSGALAVLFLLQILDPARRADAKEMQDAVIRLAEARDGKRRFAAYSIGNDLNAVADFDASRSDFDKQVRAIPAHRLRIQLFKNALDAIGKLAQEQADRRALVILGDGASDDPPAGYSHEQVVAAARRAGVVIHALGYFASEADLPKFQNMRRLADDTGGFRQEVRVGGVQKKAVSNRFSEEVLGNGGAVHMILREPPGRVALTITAEFENAPSASVVQSLIVPMPVTAALSPALPQSKAWGQSFADWLKNNKVVAVSMGLAIALGLAGLGLLALSRIPSVETAPFSGAAGQGAVYGWLDMLDGDASRYPLQSTNVRIGRHRDNDICLQNDSISRRHALLHFNAGNRRFVITDLGGSNGVIVNNIKQQSHELNDGDLVELGEVRLRFRANVERS